MSCCVFFFSSRRRHTRCSRDWSSDVCSSDLLVVLIAIGIVAVAVWLMTIGRTQAQPYILGVLALLATAGLFNLFALAAGIIRDRKSTRLNSSHGYISYADFCLKKKNESLKLQ